jgi:hypothetical protein
MKWTLTEYMTTVSQTPKTHNTSIVRSPVRRIRKTEPINKITVKLVVNKLEFLDQFGVLLCWILLELRWIFIAVEGALSVLVD